jgi:uncharacterized protein YbjT (DUF2867 family)
VSGVRSLTKRKETNRLAHYDLVEIDYDNPGTIIEALKGMDKLFLLTPTHPNDRLYLKSR